MEKGKKKGNKKLLLILIPILAVLLLGGGVFALIHFLGNKPQAPDVTTESGEETEYNSDGIIRQNVDKKYYYQMTEGGMSGREPEEDGLYHVLLGYDGAQTEYLVEKYKTVNLFDTFDLSCFVFSEDGKYITGSEKPEQCGYELLIDHFFAVTSDATSVSFNTLQDGNGLGSTYYPQGEVKIYDMAQNLKFLGSDLSIVKPGNEFVVYGKDGVEYLYIFPEEDPIETRVFWNVERKWNSELLATSREPDADGYYVFELASEGQVRTYKTKSRDVATDIDSVAARVVSLRFNKKGEIVKWINVYTVTNGSSIASWHTVTNVGDDAFHAKKLQTTAKDYLHECDVPIGENTKIYCVNDSFDVQYGEETTPRVGDTVHCIKNTEGETLFVFVVSRKMNSPVYWLVDRKYDSTKKASTRTPDADGYYSFTFAVYGEQKTLRTKDKELVEYIDGYGAMNFAMELDGDIISVAKRSAYNYAAGIVGSYASWADVTAIKSKTEFTTLKDPNSSDSHAGEVLNLVMADDCKIYNVSSNYIKFAGEETTLMVGDRIQCYGDYDGKMKLIYVVKRGIQANIYWNVTRKYDSTKASTTRTPAADGYYYIEVTTNGNQPIKVRATKAQADQIDSYAARNMGLILSGDKVVKVVASASVQGISGSTASWTDVKKVTSGGFTAVKDPTSTASYAGKSFDVKYGSGVQILNVSGTGAYIGVKDTVKVGDLVHVLTDINGNAKIVYIINRPIKADIYWNVERKYDSTNKTTTRTPDAEGYYHFEMTTGGKKPTELVTKDKAIADAIDSYSGKMMGISLKADGKTVDAVYSSTQVSGIASSTASWTHVTEMTANGFISLKDNDTSNSQYGKYFTIITDAKTNVYNVSGKYYDTDTEHYIGEKTTVRKSDLVHVYTRSGSTAAIVFVIDRIAPEMSVTEHKNTHACADCGEEVTWTPWTGPDTLPTESGHYYLCGDVTITQRSDVTSQDISICLNGYTITGENTGLYRLMEGCKLTIANCDEAGQITITGTATSGGGVASIQKTSTVNLIGIKVDSSAYTTTYGTIVYTNMGENRVNVKDCTFIGGTANGSGTNGSGGQFFIQATDIMTAENCTFTGGTTTNRAGILYLASDSAFENCVFEGGAATDGGNVYVTGATNATFKDCTFRNTTKGCGILVTNGTVKFGGKTVTTGNAGQGVYLTASGKLELMEGGLSEGSDIRIGTANPDQPFFTSDTDLTGYLTSQKTGYDVVYKTTDKVHVLTIPVVETHTHCVCGGQITDGTAFGSETHTCSDIEWTAWADDKALPTVTGNYYLTTDVAITKKADISSQKIQICLNGHTITANNIGMYKLTSGDTLTITDCAEEKGEIVLKGTTTSAGVLASMTATSTLNLYGIKVDATEAITTYGSIVYTNKGNNALNIYNCTLLGGTAGNATKSGKGASFFVQQTDVMHAYNTTFKGGTAVYDGTNTTQGGILYVYSDSVFENCVFDGGSAKDGAAMYISGSATVTLKDCEVKNSTSGNAILVGTATLKLGGKTLISENAGQSIYVSKNGKLEVLDGGLTEGSAVKVSMADYTMKILNTDVDQTAYFTSYNDAYELKYDGTDKNHYFAVPVVAHTHCICGGTITSGTVFGKEGVYTETHTCQDVTWTELGTEAEIKALIAPATAPTQPTDVYVALTQDIALTDTLRVSKNISFYLDLNGHTLTAGKDKRALSVGDGTDSFVGKIVITDCSENETGVITAHAETTKSSYSGGNILVYGAATLELYAGTIQNGRPAEQGGNISLQGVTAVPGACVFNMYGGTIQGGKTNAAKNTYYGGNIYITGSSFFNMYGGTVKDGGVLNQDSRGGNISMAGASSELRMYGGTVENGVANYGGNILVTAGKAKFYGGTVTGGICTKASSSGNGYNVYFTGGSGTFEGGLYGNPGTGSVGQSVVSAATSVNMTIHGGTYLGQVMSTNGTVYITGGNFAGKVTNYRTTNVMEISGGLFNYEPTYGQDGTTWKPTLKPGYVSVQETNTVDGTTYKYKVVKE